jgi:hypothetical protein
MPSKYGDMTNKEARLRRRRLRKFGKRGKDTTKLDQKIKDLTNERKNK